MSLESFLGVWTVTVSRAGELLGVAEWWGKHREQKSRVAAEIAKSHRDLLTLVHSMPASRQLFQRDRDLTLCPRTEEETHIVRLFLVQFSWALSEHRAGQYDLPENLAEDVRDFFSHPAINDAWSELKRFQDKKVVVFVERAFGGAN